MKVKNEQETEDEFADMMPYLEEGAKSQTKRGTSGAATLPKTKSTGRPPEARTSASGSRTTGTRAPSRVVEEERRPISRIVPRKKTRALMPLLLCGAVTAAVISGGAVISSVFRELKGEEVILPEEVHIHVPEEIPTIDYLGMKIPIESDVPVNSYDGRGFYVDSETGYLRYEVSGFSAIPGIDVSYHQREIDWKQVAEAGFEFAMIRAGRRGYGAEGKIDADTEYVTNIKGALENGLEVGVYFFSQAVTMIEVMEEFNFLMDLIQGYDITYPVVFDWEFISEADWARTDHVTGDEITDMIRFFNEKLIAAGYTPMVYLNLDFAYRYLTLSDLKDYSIWLAELNSLPRFYYHYDMLQYSFTGKVPGIEVDVDLNLSFRDFAAETRAAREELAAAETGITGTGTTGTGTTGTGTTGTGTTGTGT